MTPQPSDLRHIIRPHPLTAFRNTLAEECGANRMAGDARGPGVVRQVQAALPCARSRRGRARGRDRAGRGRFGHGGSLREATAVCGLLITECRAPFGYIAKGPVPQLDTAQVDSSHGPEFLGGEAQLAKYRAHLDWMERIALSPEASRDFIRAIANDL